MWLFFKSAVLILCCCLSSRHVSTQRLFDTTLTCRADSKLTGQHLKCIEKENEILEEQNSVILKRMYEQNQQIVEKDRNIQVLKEELDRCKTNKESATTKVSTGASGASCPTKRNFVITNKHNLCIRFFVNKASYNDSSETCKNESGHLLVIESRNVASYIKSQRPTAERYWISGTDEVVEGDWRIWNNEPMTYLFRQSEDTGSSENCAFLRNGIRDANCFELLNFICQIDQL